IAGGVTQSGGTITTTGGLRLFGAGTYTLTSAANSSTNFVGTVTGDVTYTDSGAITIGTVGATRGFVTNGGNFTLHAGTTISIRQRLTAGAGTITLNPSAACVNQTARTVSGKN